MSADTATPIAVRSILNRALDRHRRGDLAAAEALYRDALLADPRQPDALHLLGLVAIQSGRLGAGVDLITRSLESNPQQPDVHLNRGNALSDLGRLQEAVGSYEHALQLRPAFPAALLRLGNALLLLGRPLEALARYDALLQRVPDYAVAWCNRGNALQAVGRHVEAIGSYDRALQFDPRFADALVNRGNARRRLKQFEQALADYDRSLTLNADSAPAHNARGSALRDLKRPQEALLAYDAALRLQPQLADALNNRGNALRDLHRFEEALEAYEQAIRLRAGFADALSNRGIALRELRRPAEALASLQLALELDPHSADTHCNLAGALLDLKRSDEALGSYARAVTLQPDHVDVLNNQALALQQLGRYREASNAFSRIVQLSADYPYATGLMFDTALNCCDWTDYEGRRDRLVQAVIEGQRAEPSFGFLAVSDSAALQLQCARSFARSPDRPPSPPIWHGERYQHDRIRLVYLSADLREHAVSYLMAGVFEQHDRKQFETIAISLHPPEASPMGRRVQAAFDRFIDVSQLSDGQVARLIHDLQADIVIDLMGFTRESRPAILASRPAPVQVAYLGFPGTSGTDYTDYLIADEFLIPPDSRVHYSEAVVYLPHCFQANDDQRAIGTVPSRSQLGLPEDGFVFCCFNNAYKLSPALFDIWCRLLQQTADSVLWLVAYNTDTREHLYQEAEKRGIDRHRLVMAERLPYAQHLGRLAAADLFLDTVPFNAGTTASDALWAGLPVLTCTGEAFAARMAGSLLHTLGLDELIASDLVAYQRIALELVRDRERLLRLRAKLAQQREQAPLFQTRRACQSLESAFVTMWQRAERGERASPIVVPA